jgi:hypothetical protein
MVVSNRGGDADTPSGDDDENANFNSTRERFAAAAIQIFYYWQGKFLRL